MIDEEFVPVRVHVARQADDFKRLGKKYGAQWTPTILLLDDAGEEQHRIEGFLPVDDFLAQLAIGRAKAAFAKEDYARAERLYRQVTEQFGGNEAAAEALYWTGVSRYKGSGDAKALKETAERFKTQYQNSVWAKKSSVWA